jgi:hypothetical protein
VSDTKISDKTFTDLFNGVVKAVQDGTGLLLSDKIIDPSFTAGTWIDRSFSVEMQSLNTGEYRDRIRGHISMGNTVTVRSVHTMDPMNETTTQCEAFQDEGDTIIALMNSTTTPLCHVRRRYEGGNRELNESREFLFTEAVFIFKFDFSLVPRSEQ